MARPRKVDAENEEQGRSRGGKKSRIQVYLTEDVAQRFIPVQQHYGKTASETAAEIIYAEIERLEGGNTEDHYLQAMADSLARLEALITHEMAVLQTENKALAGQLEILKLLVWALINKRTLKLPAASDVLAMDVTELMATMPEAAKPKIRAILKDIIGPPANEQPDK